MTSCHWKLLHTRRAPACTERGRLPAAGNAALWSDPNSQSTVLSVCYNTRHRLQQRALFLHISFPCVAVTCSWTPWSQVVHSHLNHSVILHSSASATLSCSALLESASLWGNNFPLKMNQNKQTNKNIQHSWLHRKETKLWLECIFQKVRKKKAREKKKKKIKNLFIRKKKKKNESGDLQPYLMIF